MPNEVIPADARMGNAYLAVKIVAEIAAVALTLRMIRNASAGPSPSVVFWDKIRSLSYKGALELGKLGLYAEARYQEMVK